MADVFISYPQKAVKDASAFADALNARGVKTWYAKKNLLPTDNPKDAIQHALKEAKAVAFLITSDPGLSHWVREEYMTALESSWKNTKTLLVPLLIRDAVPPSFLQQWQSIRVKDKSDWPRAADQVVTWLRSSTLPIKSAKRARGRRDQRLNEIDELMHNLQIDRLILDKATIHGVTLNIEELRSQLNPKLTEILFVIDENRKTPKAKK